MEYVFTDSVTPKKFAGFVWPSVLMMVIIGLYYNIDSVFVANFVGEKALAALSIAYPIQGIMWGLAVMLAAGSSAIVAIKMGEGNQHEANEKYTLVCVLSIVLGIAFMLFCMVFMDQIISFMGASGTLKPYCHDFLSILVWSFPASFLGSIFEYFIRIDGRPGFTLLLYVSGGVVHVALDYVFMGMMDMGIEGAAYNCRQSSLKEFCESFVFLVSVFVLTHCHAYPLNGSAVGFSYLIIKRDKSHVLRFSRLTGDFLNRSSEETGDENKFIIHRIFLSPAAAVTVGEIIISYNRPAQESV